ncbi:MAG TPA: hypothetical protein VFM55_00575 [Micromonosporaceae bacterium]|nr:hypothetical protein [Micromonosporaceae bacterium]
MADERARHFRRLRRLHRSARRWSVAAGGLGGAALVLTPYSGLGLADAGWMAAAGGTAALAVWRWIDLRTLAAQPAPPPPDPALAAERTRRRIEGFVASLPGGREAIVELRRHRDRSRLRGSSVLDGWRRLDLASQTLAGLAGRLGGPAGDAVLEAAVAERALRELADRAASVERASRFATGEARTALDEGQAALVAHFTDGVTAYESLVAAAAAYVAEDGRAVEHPSVARLTEAADLLRAIAAGYAELRTAARPTPG